MLNSTNCKEEEKDSSLKLVETIAQVIHDKAGKNVFAIDIRDVSSLCDFCIVAEGTVDRHVRAIAKAIEEELALLGHKASRIEGIQEGNWAILDYLNVMVHVLTPSFREKYHLERLWKEGTIIDLNYES